ncbi:hypothetical protein RB195_019407 [Necator americanus]|uniref:L-type lectin-like domain-containing protein n=1 Tax=Necator americanus TaxID=51031 RepID=A0ABR1CG88_NECAM
MLPVAVVMLPFLGGSDAFTPQLPLETAVDDVRGYELHNLQLIRPYSNTPHWDLRGDAFISRNKIRLTREAQSLNGSIWSRNRVMVRDWEIQVDLRIYSASSPPADGIAIWYIRKPDTGSAWGGPANFSGIGVVLDTYTNTIGGMTSRQSSRLFVILNNPAHGAVVDSSTDGSNLRVESECSLGNDPVAYKVPPSYDHTPTIRILIRYVHEYIEVLYALPTTEHWKLCTNASALFLPINYHVGVSAATGELKSTHELLSLKVYQIDTPPHILQKPVDMPVYLAAFTGTPGAQETSSWNLLEITIFVVSERCR